MTKKTVDHSASNSVIAAAVARGDFPVGVSKNGRKITHMKIESDGKGGFRAPCYGQNSDAILEMAEAPSYPILRRHLAEEFKIGLMYSDLVLAEYHKKELNL